MMVAQVGTRLLKISKPSGTSLTTVYTIPTSMLDTLYFVNIAAISAADASVVYNDGSTDYELLSAKTISADETILLEWREGIPMRGGDILKVKTSVADAIVFISMFEEVPSRG